MASLTHKTDLQRAHSYSVKTRERLEEIINLNIKELVKHKTQK